MSSRFSILVGFVLLSAVEHATATLAMCNDSALLPLDVSTNPQQYAQQVRAIKKLIAHCHSCNGSMGFSSKDLEYLQPTQHPYDWATQAHALSKLNLEPRRNHDTLIHPVTEEVLLVGGRYAGSIEAWDLFHSGVASIKVRDQLLELNHVAAVITRSSAGKHELWIMCGFEGNALQQEQATDFVRIVDLETYAVRLGPKLVRPNGGCTAVTLPGYIFGHTTELLCLLGGAQGYHGTGTMLDAVECFDRTIQAWRVLGNMPATLDHANIAVVSTQTCNPSGEPGLDVVLFNGRNLAFGMPSDSLYRLPIRPSTGLGSWETSKILPPKLTRSAAAAVAVNDRYLISTGGLHHFGGQILDVNNNTYRKSRPFRNIVVTDLCTQQTCLSPMQLVLARSAYLATVHVKSNVLVLCGGLVMAKKGPYVTPFGQELVGNNASDWDVWDAGKNMGYCEVMDAMAIVASCTGRWTAPLQSGHKAQFN
jgi:hypothetical protein